MENEEILEETFTEREFEYEEEYMEDELTETNTGKSIQTMGRTVKVLGTLMSIVGSIICFWGASEAYSYEKGGYIIAGIVVLIVGIISSIILGIFIEGFGELVENSHILHSIQDDINEIKNKK